MNARERRARLRRIESVVFDCDGVLTNGSINIAADGGEVKSFNVHDGSGIKYLQRAGLKTAILSGRRAEAVTRRAKELKISCVFQGRKDKLKALSELCRRMKVGPEAVCYVGDDLPDLPVMRAVGFAVAVADARPEVRKAAHYVTRAAGGAGAAREVAEMILQSQAKWGDILARYLPPTGLGAARRTR